MKRWKISILGLIIASFLIIAVGCEPPGSTPTNPGPGSDQGSGECDRECLMGVLDNYLEALAARNASALEVAGTLKYVENGVEAQLGDGLWKTAVRIDNDKRLDFADTAEGNVASQLVIYEEAPVEEVSDDEAASGGCGGTEDGLSPVIYQVRLKVEQRKITEIEAMTVRRRNAANGFFMIATMKPTKVFLQDPSKVAENGPASREELITVFNQYVNYLTRQGLKDENVTDPVFAEGCIRFENGIPTAMGPQMFEMQNFWFFNVVPKSVVVDEEQGIVWGMLPFFSESKQFTLMVGEAFKIYDGKIHMIQAVMNWQPIYEWD